MFVSLPDYGGKKVKKKEEKKRKQKKTFNLVCVSLQAMVNSFKVSYTTYFSFYCHNVLKSLR